MEVGGSSDFAISHQRASHVVLQFWIENAVFVQRSETLNELPLWPFLTVFAFTEHFFIVHVHIYNAYYANFIWYFFENDNWYFLNQLC